MVFLVDRTMSLWQMDTVAVDSSDLIADDQGLSCLCSYLRATSVNWCLLPGPLWDRGCAEPSFRNLPNVHFTRDPERVFPEDAAPRITFNIFAISLEQMKRLNLPTPEGKPEYMLVGQIANEAYIKAIIDRVSAMKD